MVIQAEEEKERLALENKKQQKQIEKLQPKADLPTKPLQWKASAI